MSILVLDNFDSFTYNLVHLVEKISQKKVKVFRNNEITPEQADEYEEIILSPGPGLPSEAGILLSMIRNLAHRKKILGVCLGHQAIGEAFGGKLKNLENVLHGVTRSVKISEAEFIFRNLPVEIETGRYHSWVIDKKDFPEELIITAVDEQDEIMAVRHKKFNIHGVQFHPESIMTPFGEKILENWLNQNK